MLTNLKEFSPAQIGAETNDFKFLRFKFFLLRPSPSLTIFLSEKSLWGKSLLRELFQSSLTNLSPISSCGIIFVGCLRDSLQIHRLGHQHHVCCRQEHPCLSRGHEAGIPPGRALCGTLLQPLCALQCLQAGRR